MLFSRKYGQGLASWLVTLTYSVKTTAISLGIQSMRDIISQGTMNITFMYRLEEYSRALPVGLVSCEIRPVYINTKNVSWDIEIMATLRIPTQNIATHPFRNDKKRNCPDNKQKRLTMDINFVVNAESLAWFTSLYKTGVGANFAFFWDMEYQFVWGITGELGTT